MKEKDYLIIDRSKWRTGGTSYENQTGIGDTLLLNKEGFQCCLGFRCEQMGVMRKDLLRKAYPKDLSDKYDIPDLINSNPRYDNCNNSFVNEAVTINDNGSIGSKKREKMIKEHFKRIDVTVEFIGEYDK